MFKAIVIILATVWLTGCLEEQGSSSEIVIPPGSLLQFDLTQTNTVSTKKYSIYLAEFNQEDKKTKNLLDMTTEAKPDYVRTIMPKGLSPTGAMVLKIVMEFRTTPWYAMVYPGEVITPSLETTLVYNLLSSYSGRALNTYTAAEIKAITDAVTRFKEERLLMFGISPNFNPDLLYRFLRNGLSSSYDFLSLLKGYGVEFTYNADGDITQEPYPFGIVNRSPILDEKSTTKVTQQRVEEGKKLEIRATARDPDGDQVFYAWMFQGSLVTGEDGLVRWEPSYDHGRSDPYTMSVILSDGGKITRVDWPVLVENVNRRPTFTQNCPTEIAENKEWKCRVQFRDQDGDAVKVSAEGLAGSNPLFLNDQMAPVDIENVSEVEVRWTPNNEDARKGLNTVPLQLVDSWGGLTLVNLQVKVLDTNAAPLMLGGVNPIYDNAIEWDYCALENPDGVEPYQFYLDFQDPDNVGSTPASPPDVITVTTAGTLKSHITQVGSAQVLPDRVRYTFVWKPLHTLLKGSFIVTLKDNHNGTTPPITLNLSAADRNTKPCMAGSDLTLQVRSIKLQHQSSMSVSDKDNDTLWLEAFNFSEAGTGTSRGARDVLANLQDCGTNQPLILRRVVGMTEPTYRRNASSFCMRLMHNSEDINGGIAGYVRFQRSAEDTVTRTIATTHTFTDPTTGVVFKPRVAVTINPGDLEVWFPVFTEKSAGTAAIGTLTSTPAAGYTVTNPAAFYNRGLVTFTRATAATPVVIPKYTEVKTASGRLIKTRTADDLSMAAGVFSASIPVWRVPQMIPDNTVLTQSNPVAGPAGTISAISGANVATTLPNSPGLYDWNENVVSSGTSNTQTLTRRFRVRAIDGFRLLQNSTDIAFVAPLPVDADKVTLKNKNAILIHEGKIVFGRKAGTGTPAITLPAGTQLKTTNKTLYELVFAVTLAAGSSANVEGWIKRINNEGATTTAGVKSRLVSTQFIETNNASVNVGPTIIVANEGVTLQDGLILMSDSSAAMPVPYYKDDGYWYPLDMPDYFRIKVEPVGTGPVGKWDFCRTPGTPVTNAVDCVASRCNTDSGVVADRTFFKTNRCYLRYIPHAQDLSGTFNFKVTTTEISPWAPVYTGISTITLQVKEINKKPVLTNSSFAPIGGGVGASVGNPLVLGDFNEGVESLYNIYVVDNNKGSELQTVDFEMDAQIYDLKTSSWRSAPAGLKVQVEKREALTPGPGTKTTARLTWNPTDEEAKKYSGNSGLVVKIKIFDAKTMPDVREAIDGFFKIRLINKNQIPSIAQIVAENKFTIFADAYFYRDIYLYDKDAYTPEGGSFSTQMTLCRDSNGVALQHPTLDSGSADPYICHATNGAWAEELTTYDPAYKRNITVAQCGDGTNINTDLAVPKLTPVGSPELVGGVQRQRYKMEWCPQRMHIGTYSAELFVNDNGDVDRDGSALARAVSATPLRINVVAPAYFVSPRQNLAGNPVHFMPHTAASMPSEPFKYPVIVNNSQGNTLEYSLVSSPRPCGEPNGMCIDSAKGIITWNPSYPGDMTEDGGAGHLVRVRVKDLKTQETDTVGFYVKVQNPLSPFEVSPVINSSMPAGTDVLVSEKSSVSFSVTASDANLNDTLFYRWYVNDRLLYDEGASFTYKPKDTDGSLDPDGSGPLKSGEFMVRAEVTDGNYIVTREWKLKIRNNYLLGEQIFDLYQARPESLPSQSPLNLSWNLEGFVSVGTGANIVDHVVFAGTYMLGAFKKHFLWDFSMVNGTVSKPNGTLVNPPWNYSEDIPWLTGTESRRLGLLKTGSSFDIILTSQSGRAGPFGMTTEALRIPAGDLTGISLGAGNKCIGDCPQDLFLTPIYSDARFTESMNSTYVFYSSDNKDKLMYDYLSPASPVQIYNFGAARISGMALNKNLDRLYVTTQQSSPSVAHKIWVFNVAPIRSGGAAALVAQLNIWDGVIGHEDSKPTDIVIDTASHRVITLLSGTGGVAVLTDGPSKTPTVADIQFVGVNEISSSQFDVPGQGKRLVIRPDDRMVIGTMKDANQVFTIDLDSYHVYTNSMQDPVDSIGSFDSGQILLISRSKGRIYRAR